MKEQPVEILTFEFFGFIPPELRKDPDDPESTILEMVDMSPEVVAARRAKHAELLGRTTLIATEYGNEVELHTGKSLDQLRGKTVEIEQYFQLSDQAVMPYFCRTSKTRNGCRFQIMNRPLLDGTKVVPHDRAETLIARLRKEVERMRIMGCWLNPPHPSVTAAGLDDRPHINLVLDVKGLKKQNLPAPDEMTLTFSPENDRVMLRTKYFGATSSFGTKVTVEEVKEGVAETIAAKVEAGEMPAPPSTFVPHFRSQKEGKPAIKRD